MTAEAFAAGAAAVAVQHYVDRRDLAATVFDAATKWWGLLDKADMAASWTERVAPGIVSVIEAGQAIAAAQADPYVDALDREWAIIGAPDYRLDPAPFVGTGTDGRLLMEIIDNPMLTTRRLLSGGLEVDLSLKAGLYQAQRIAVNEVQAAGNEADQMLATARDYSGGYRVLNLPCCSRCAVLAGKFYTWNAGFERHPNCDCTHLPTRDDLGGVDSEQWDVTDAVASGQVTGLSQADLDAIMNHGASLSRIVGRQVSGMAFARGRFGSRMTIFDIYQLAGDDRQEAVRLLLDLGYIVST